MTKKGFMTLVLTPAMSILLVLSIYPIIQVIILSLQNKVLTRPGSGQFVGFANYIKVFGDRRFWNALKVTMMWEVITVTFTMILAILFAVIIYKNVNRIIKPILIMILIIPAVLPRVAAAYTWRFMYSPLLGIFNYFLSLVNIPAMEFLSNKYTALGSVALIDIWQWSTLLSVIILGALESIPIEPLEAAKLDGVGKIRLHRYITLPIIKPSLISIFFLKVIESLRSFDLIYILTKGGPGITTETIDLYAYNRGLAMGGRISYGAVISLIMLIFTLILANVLWGVMKNEEEE